LLIDEVEVVVQALAAGRLEERLVGLLVVPRPVARTSLHRRQNVNKAGVVTAPGKDLLDPRFLAGAALAHELDLDASLGGELLGVGSHRVAQRLGKAWIVEDADVLCVQVRGHAAGVTEAGERSPDHDAVPA